MNPLNQEETKDVPSKHRIQYYPISFQDSQEEKEKPEYSRDLFRWSKEDELNDETQKILKTDLSTHEGRTVTATYFGISDDELVAIESHDDITKIQDEFYKARWKKARSKNETALVFVAEEGQHRLLLWSALHCGSQYSPKQAYLKHGSIDTHFLRKNNLHSLPGFNAESDLICKDEELHVYENLEKQLKREDTLDTDKSNYYPLRSTITVSIRHMLNKEEILKNHEELKTMLLAKTVLRLIKVDSSYCKKDKYDTSRLNVMDTVIGEMQFISEKTLPGNQFYKPSFKRNGIKNFKNLDKLRKESISDDISEEDYHLKVPDPDFLKLEEVQNYIINPTNMMYLIKMINLFKDHNGVIYNFKSTNDPRHELETKLKEKNLTLQVDGYVSPLFNNTFDSMKELIFYGNDVEDISMSTQIANKIILIPTFLAATMKNEEKKDARQEATKYFLKYHICPNQTEYPKLAPQSKLYNFRNRESKFIYARGMESIATALFLEKLMNAILSFDGTIQRFIDMCTALNQDEISLGTNIFKARMCKLIYEN